MKRRTILLVVAVGVVSAGAIVAFLARNDRLHAAPRREWKDQAIARIERRRIDRPALLLEIDRIRKTLATTRPLPDAWIGEGVLVMTNGEWILCENICSKEDARIHDLFIGHASDGKWYYSTFHFCRGLTVLRHMEEWQPDSLSQFVKAYWLVPFDGRSNACLKATWTGTEAFGQAKVQYPQDS
jgi:hypothetical protein